ncbi:MAG: hypothetical protein ACXWKS_07550, partial [Rhizomicrobium sp.]
GSTPACRPRSRSTPWSSGACRPRRTLSPHAAEVAEIFEVPLSFLLDPVNKKTQSREFQGNMRTFYSFTYEGHYIWGATAAMLLNFGERITAP